MCNIYDFYSIYVFFLNVHTFIVQYTYIIRNELEIHKFKLSHKYSYSLSSARIVCDVNARPHCNFDGKSSHFPTKKYQNII